MPENNFINEIKFKQMSLKKGQRVNKYLTSLFLFLLVGCSANSDLINGSPESAEGLDWENIGYEEILDMRSKRLLELQDVYFAMPNIKEKIGSFPDVPLVRFVTMDEWPDVMVDCLSEKGYDVRRDSMGYIFRDTAANSDQENTLDIYICEAQYTIDPRTLGVKFPRLRAEMLYEYRTNEYANCVADLGYHTSDPPSLESWLDRYYQEGYAWDPASEVRVVIGFSETLQEELDNTCPEYPADFWPVIPTE